MARKFSNNGITMELKGSGHIASRFLKNTSFMCDIRMKKQSTPVIARTLAKQ